MQTEDFGRTYATQRLEYQAQYENERRWLSLDLLCGRVDDRHPFYTRLLSSGVDPRCLRELAAAPCAPDIVGVDYYLTSDRFLDHRTSRIAAKSLGETEGTFMSTSPPSGPACLPTSSDWRTG